MVAPWRSRYASISTMSTQPRTDSLVSVSQGAAVAPVVPRGERVLHAEGLTVEFLSHHGPVRIVSDVSFDIDAGRTLSLVGESGCGKSVSVMAMLGLLPRRQWRIAARAVSFEGLDLLDPAGRNLRAVRGRRIGMIFQEPMTSLNPTMTVGEQIAEVLRYPPAARPACRASGRRSAARSRPDPARRRARRRLPLRLLRRHAPARDDRARPCLLAGAAHRRRADHRARRHRPGRDLRPPPRAPARNRHRPPPHHPRPRRRRRNGRRGGGHVCRPDRRAIARRDAVRDAAAPLYDRPARRVAGVGVRARTG